MACEAQSRNIELQLKKKEAEIEEATKAPDQIAAAHTRRLDAYAECVKAMEEELRCLEALYEPLRDRLESPGLQKLSFRVQRTVDLDVWVKRGERLLDLRKRLPFPDNKTLKEVAEQYLLKAWLTESAAQAREAMASFTDQFGSALISARAAGATPHDLADWLFTLEHVSVRYSVRYEDVELSRLSPGTRGVVLLTLYLALDDSDQRPLVIDQPEENLDPKSVYGDLVGFFRSASLRRQVVMVTHNANLVVNTDADQVITAASERATPGALPNILYEAGGLEEAWVRESVCGLLEGGREAFEARQRRYGPRS